jgi:hypothetical protein
VNAEIEATMLLAFERLCRNCVNVRPHPIYRIRIPLENGQVLEGMEEAEDEGPTCCAGLRPLTRDGNDCPYFKAPPSQESEEKEPVE